MDSLSTLKQNKKDAETKLKQYEKRLKEVKDIRENLDKACKDYVLDINCKIESALSYLDDGLSIKITDDESIFFHILQVDEYEDFNLSSCRSHLSKEITRIKDKIRELKREICVLKSSIQDVEDK